MVIITFVCGFIERLACYSLPVRLSSRVSCKHGAYTMLCLWVQPVLWLGGSSGWWQPRLFFVVHSELSRFLNYRTVVTAVELSIFSALLSKLGMKTKMIISDFLKSFSSFFRFLCLNENDSGNRKNENDNGKNNRKRKWKWFYPLPIVFEDSRI
jgi:hypothetical protein